MKRRELLKGIFGGAAAAALGAAGVKAADAGSEAIEGDGKWHDNIDLESVANSAKEWDAEIGPVSHSDTKLAADLRDPARHVTDRQREEDETTDALMKDADLSWAEVIQRGKIKRWAETDRGDYDQIDPDWRRHPNHDKLFGRLKGTAQSTHQLQAKVQEAREDCYRKDLRENLMASK
jgi:hypothetical protein